MLANTGGAPALVSALEGGELAARRALAISHKLMSFNRPDVAQPETFDVGAALQDLQPMLRRLLGSDIRAAAGAARGRTAGPYGQE